MNRHTIVLAGQPNCGKSTVFNGLTGAKQLVANYPGVTVDKMYGWYKHDGQRVDVIDLPGTYSLTSYSPEEKVARDVILYDKPSLAVNVVDAANVKRGLYLTFQLLEMGTPLIVVLNMIDVAEKTGLEIDMEGLSRALGVRVVATAMKSGRGKGDLLEAIAVGSNEGVRTDTTAFNLYPELEAFVAEVSGALAVEKSLQDKVSQRWLAVKLLENDAEAVSIVAANAQNAEALLADVEALRAEFERKNGQSVELYVAGQRYRKAAEIADTYVTKKNADKVPLSERIDKVVCNRFLGPIFLLAVIYMLYNLSIVQGYKLTTYTWPLLAGFRSIVESLLPTAGFVHTPLVREFVLWFIDSVNALLNYIPIFFILFGLIAILEDSGYMPRMAFIMDRLLSRSGCTVSRLCRWSWAVWWSAVARCRQ